MSEGRQRRSPVVRSDSGPGGAAVWSTTLAVAQEDDAIGPRSQLRLVRHDDARDAALGCGAEQSHDGFTVHRVQCAGRLVREQEVAFADDRTGDRDPLTLAAGELIRVPIRALGDGELFQGLPAGLLERPLLECRRVRGAA